MPTRFFASFLTLLLSVLPAVANPTLYLIGDSTVHNNTRGQEGWGEPLIKEFDSAKLTVSNHAIGGRSSRTFMTEGKWEEVLKVLKKGDFVVMQFGHNDGGKIDDPQRPRASLKGNGEETKDYTNPTTHAVEAVHSYGWYLRKYIADAKAKGAIPIVASPIPRNLWKDGKIGRSDKDYGLWAKEAAAAGGAQFIDFNKLLADEYEKIGQEKTAALFAGTDHTHTGPPGAEFNAKVMARALGDLTGTPFAQALVPASTAKATP